ncbi:hypothetical protein CEXT_693621 [Caerostris extrusa]|uniref:Uncharacterized protein n=1 Tax=Caerostris extrusa TaxID=172846 RepID=A0AAV4XZN0_CAEEX|nr:hypothetical protein CEXT_693621 [Caerostris extrusa]
MVESDFVGDKHAEPSQAPPLEDKEFRNYRLISTWNVRTSLEADSNLNCAHVPGLEVPQFYLTLSPVASERPLSSKQVVGI